MRIPTGPQDDPAIQPITITLTPHEVKVLTWLTQRANLTNLPDLFATFAGDLSSSWRNGGSDERNCAFEWFRRRHAQDGTPYSYREAVEWFEDWEEMQADRIRAGALPLGAQFRIGAAFEEDERIMDPAGYLIGKILTIAPPGEDEDDGEETVKIDGDNRIYYVDRTFLIPVAKEGA